MSQSRTVRDLRIVTSNVHPGQPCTLCKKGNQSKYFHPKSWKDASLLERLKQLEPSLNIEPHSCICRPCRNEVKNIMNDGFIPRWRKSNKGMCFVPKCTHSAQKVTKLANELDILAFFSIDDIDKENIGSQPGVPLCTEHYGAWYRHAHASPSHKHCKTCGKLLTDMSKSRPYPQPKLIQQFLAQNTDFSGEINLDDRACYSCYKSHLVTIRHLNSTTQSTNADLGTLLNQIKRDLPAPSDIHTIENVVSYTCNITAIYVGEILLKHTAILLPEANDFFNQKLKETAHQCAVNLDSDTAETITATWLRSKLSSILKPHMAYKCSLKSCGTVLYWYGGDLMHALNVALGQARNLKKSAADAEDDVCLSLNGKVHTCIKKLIEQDKSNPHDIQDINLDKFIQGLEPDVWKAICLLTQPLSSKAIKGTSHSNHVRKIRRCFCTCVLLFSTNSQCSFPLHTLITDAIETCGGSSRLQKLLNRLGACACIDTHDRYLQYRVEKKMKEGPMAAYPQDPFMIVSADNLDYVHGCA